MCGVGYDLESLSIAKFAPTNPKTIARNKRRREREEAEAADEKESNQSCTSSSDTCENGGRNVTSSSAEL